MRATAEPPPSLLTVKGGFIALLLLQLEAALDNTAEASQHGLLLPGVSGHQYFQLLLRRDSSARRHKQSFSRIGQSAQPRRVR